jgi:Uma2 family endonuclease
MSTVQLRIGPADRGRRMSLEEFREADEAEGYRYELAEGVLEVTEVPGPAHRRVVGNLYRAIARYDADHPGVIETYGGGSEFRLWIPSRASGRNPDLGVVLEGTLPDARGRTQPALVGEVVSRSSRDRDYQTKRQEYLLFGIREYWIVDPMLRSVTVLSRLDDDWAEQIAREDQTIPSQILPGLKCRVGDVWVGVVGETSSE